MTVPASTWLAAALPLEHASLAGWNAAADKLAAPGRYFIAVSLAILGIDHLWVPGLIAGLIPEHWFWVYFTAAGFIAAAASIASAQHVRLDGRCWGSCSFFGWCCCMRPGWPPRAPRRTGREACPTKCYDPLVWSDSVLPPSYALPGWAA